MDITPTAPAEPTPFTPDAAAFFAAHGFAPSGVGLYRNARMTMPAVAGRVAPSVSVGPHRPSIGRCPYCKRPVRVEHPLMLDGWLALAGYRVIGDWYGVCAPCQRVVRVETLRARKVAHIRCGARCTGATGPNCDCSCGGENHGRHA